ncbi:hotdog fold thioesterase [Siminovitchia fortis]|uniref:Hotdog fold thioesterase n=1 Tax=Siminovitchia fortis TaxID=254758 RepID=A0A443ISP1_9BACI|nr:hotdog fold thioesterase [Siminovitchia fortis]RWR10373.1 hotdog fold thioesterase [Siminovitchia fortis]WHY82952.1 hotdog fold thioesterase [Siminovitchia fortis]
MNKVDERKVHQSFYDEIFSVLEQEPYARHLGIKLETLGEGTASAALEVQKHMLNSHETVHGAILFALADYVFASASNSYGKTAVGLTTTMNFMAPAQEGDILRAEATEEKRSNRLAWYKIKVFCEDELLATMDATVYRKNDFFVSVEEMEKGTGFKK